MTRVTINGKIYEEVEESQFPFGNACRHCAFDGTDCYNDDDFSCHSDSRKDGKGVIFREVKNP